MQRTPVQNLLPSPLQTPPAILLRVECHDENSPNFNRTFQNFNMVARVPNREITWEGFDDCLSWKEVDTPFIPFTSRWGKAMRKRQWLIKNGARNVVIVAIWSKGLDSVYDAYQVASELGYDFNPRKRLANHLDEYLVHGGVWADEYRVLAIFDGSEETNVELHMPQLRGTTQIPRTFMTNAPGRTANEKLENEVYMHTGIRGKKNEQLMILVGVMIRAFDDPSMAYVVGPNMPE